MPGMGLSPNSVTNRVSVSVVTVTYNNLAGLAKTLASLQTLKVKPAEILVIDGGSEDYTKEALDKYAEVIPELRYISERDNGIYDAMNKGKRLVASPLIHYLNAGDTVQGEPYENTVGPARLLVDIYTADDAVGWRDFVRLRGFGYCHQGLLLPVSHAEYDTRYKLAADFDVIMRSFPEGIHALPVCSNGRARYYLGGVSSHSPGRLDREIILIATRNRGLFAGAYFFLAVMLRHLFPRSLRRLYARSFHAIP